MSRALIKFHSAIKSAQTRKVYDKCLNYFLKFVKIKEADGLLQLRESALQEMIEDYVIWMKDRGLRTNTVNGRVVALELLMAMNDKVLNFKKIKKMYPARVKLLGGRAWTTAEIQKQLSLTSFLRNRAIIHFLASTGCRIGALEGLRLKHISNMSDGCKSVLFYEGSTEEYCGFLTQEASGQLTEYLEYRRKSGEYLNENSPVFRTTFRIGMAKAKGMSVGALQMCIREIVRKMRGVGDGSRREVAQFGGYRKRFNTILKNNKEINANIAERLMGHFSKTIPLDTFYYQPSKEVLYAEFKKAIPDLIVDDGERERVRRIEAEKKVEVLENEKDKEIEQLKQQQEETADMVKSLWELLGKKG